MVKFSFKLNKFLTTLLIDFRQLIWTNQNIRNMTLNSFIVFSAGYLFVNYGSIYFVEALGGSKQQLAIILSIYNFILMFISIPAGIVIERIGKRKSLIVSTLIHTVTTLGRAVTTNWKMYGAYTIGQSISPAITNLVPDLLIADEVPEEKLGKTISLYMTVTTIPMFVFPLLGGLIASQFGLRMQFLVAGLVFMVAVPFATRLSRVSRDITVEQESVLQGLFNGFFVFRTLAGRQLHNFLILFGMNIMRWMAISILYIYFTLYLREVAGFSLIQIGVYVTMLQVFAFIFRIPLGYLVDDKSNRKLFLALDGITDIIFALGCLFFPNPAVIFGLALLNKTFDIPGSIVNDILFATLFESEKRTKIYAFKSFAYNIGGMIAPLLSALLIQKFGGYNVLFYIYIVGTALFLSFIPFIKLKEDHNIKIPVAETEASDVS